MNAILTSNITPWRPMGAEFSPALAFYSTDPDDLEDTSTKPATSIVDGRFVIDCDAGGLAQIKIAAGEASNNDTLKFRVFTWSVTSYDGTDFYSPDYITEVTATVGTKLAGPSGVIAGVGGYFYCDTLVIDNMANSRSVRVVGRDNGADDDTNTADQLPMILEFDRRADSLIEVQTQVVDGARPLPILRFCSGL